jgi:hypothetical protein
LLRVGDYIYIYIPFSCRWLTYSMLTIENFHLTQIMTWVSECLQIQHFFTTIALKRNTIKYVDFDKVRSSLKVCHILFTTQECMTNIIFKFCVHLVIVPHIYKRCVICTPKFWQLMRQPKYWRNILLTRNSMRFKNY